MRINIQFCLLSFYDFQTIFTSLILEIENKSKNLNPFKSAKQASGKTFKPEFGGLIPKNINSIKSNLFLNITANCCCSSEECSMISVVQAIIHYYYYQIANKKKFL